MPTSHMNIVRSMFSNADRILPGITSLKRLNPQASRNPVCDMESIKIAPETGFAISTFLYS